MILLSISITDIISLITAISALLTGVNLWYDKRARLIATIESSNGYYYLLIENIGKNVARDVKISIDKNFIDTLPDNGRIKNILYAIQNRKFIIRPGVTRKYLLMASSQNDSQTKLWFQKYSYLPFDVNIEYNGWFDYRRTFFMGQFKTEALAIKNETEKISDELKEINKNIKEIKKNLCKYGQTENAKL